MKPIKEDVLWGSYYSACDSMCPPASVKNIFMLGLNDFNHQKLKSLKNFEHYRFYGLIPPEEAEDVEEYDIKAMLDDLELKLNTFNGSVDSICTYIDFPMSMMTPILRPKYGLPSPSLESIVKSQHKYWSRVEQKKVVPDNIPKFCKVNPFADDPFATVDIPFPFWVKPIKSVGSYLGFHIKNRKEFDRVMGVVRQHIGRMAGPFNYILDQTDMPDDLREVDGRWCIAEQLIGGRQCTLEGYMFHGKLHIHGVVDSIRHSNRSSFSHYDYPSMLPKSVQERMTNISKKVLKQIGYDNHPFNIEFFWNKSTDKIWLLEINTRISQSHSDLFEKVDGTSNHQVTVELSLNHDPKFPYRKGQYKRASKFFYRKWEDAIVKRIPTPAEIAAIENDIPGVLVDVKVHEGQRLNDMFEQDSYSYELAWIFIGADSHREIMQKHKECIGRLHFEFDPVSNDQPVGQKIETTS